jgi:hypothetical protein
MFVILTFGAYLIKAQPPCSLMLMELLRLLRELLSLLRELLINFQFETQNILFVLLGLLISLSFTYYFRLLKVPELYLLMLFAIFFTTIILSKYVRLNIPITNGVSRANFLGQSSWDSTISLLIVIACVYFPVLILSVYRNSKDNQVKDQNNVIEVKSVNKLGHFYKLLLVLGAILIFPNISGFAPQADKWVANGTNWDVQNLITWDELYILGYTPMKDFWYPYGNLIFTEAFPSFGRLVLWIFQLCFLVLSMILVSNISKIKSVIYPIITLSIFVYLFQTDFWAIVRYGLPAVVSGMLLFYFLNPKYKQNSFIIVQAALVTSPWVGGSIHLLLTVLSALAVIIGFIVQFRINHHKFYCEQYFNRNTIPFIVSWNAYTLYSLKQGQFQKELLYQLNNTNILAKNAYPMDIFGNLLNNSGLVILTFFIMTLISAISFSKILIIKGDLTEIRNYCVIFLITVSGFLAAYKWSFRGDLNDIKSIAIMSTLLFLASNRFEWKINARFSIYYSLIIILISSLLLSSIVKVIPSRLNNFLTNINLSTIKILKNEKENLENRQKYHSDFSEIDNLVNLSEYLEKEKLIPFYAPTDNGYLNIILRQKPYYYITGYDSSTRYDNEVLLMDLKKDMPKSIVIDARSLNFDSVHLTLRHPLVIKWLVENYELSFSIGSYSIFTQNLDSFQNNLGDWNSVFGEIDLGNVPYFISEGDACKIAQECEKYIKVKLDRKLEFCKFTVFSLGVESKFFFPNRFDSEFAIIPFSRLWSVDKKSELKEIDCAAEYKVIERKLHDNLF